MPDWPLKLSRVQSLSQWPRTFVASSPTSPSARSSTMQATARAWLVAKVSAAPSPTLPPALISTSTFSVRSTLWIAVCIGRAIGSDTSSTLTASILIPSSTRDRAGRPRAAP